MEKSDAFLRRMRGERKGGGQIKQGVHPGKRGGRSFGREKENSSKERTED